jgi:K+-transporting ATPase KdpF subunit
VGFGLKPSPSQDSLNPALAEVDKHARICDGSRLYRPRGRLLPGFGLACERIEKPLGMRMLYGIGAILSVALMVYLMVALLKPEKF